VALAIVSSEPAELLMPHAAEDPTEAFVRRHLRSVWRYLRMQGADPEEADDLTQEAFVTALGKGVRNLDDAAAQVFLRRTARFAFLHHVRDRRRDPALADAVDELWTRDCEADGGDELVTSLQRCVDELQTRARHAVQRCYGIGCERRAHDDVARELEMKPNGLKTLLQRTRRALRECVERRMR